MPGTERDPFFIVVAQDRMCQSSDFQHCCEERKSAFFGSGGEWLFDSEIRV